MKTWIISLQTWWMNLHRLTYDKMDATSSWTMDLYGSTHRMKKMHGNLYFNTKSSQQSDILLWIRVRDNHHSPNHLNNLKSTHFRSGQRRMKLDLPQIRFKWRNLSWKDEDLQSKLLNLQSWSSIWMDGSTRLEWRKEVKKCRSRALKMAALRRFKNPDPKKWEQPLLFIAEIP